MKKIILMGERSTSLQLLEIVEKVQRSNKPEEIEISSHQDCASCLRLPKGVSVELFNPTSKMGLFESIRQPNEVVLVGAGMNHVYPGIIINYHLGNTLNDVSELLNGRLLIKLNEFEPIDNTDSFGRPKTNFFSRKKELRFLGRNRRHY